MRFKGGGATKLATTREGAAGVGAQQELATTGVSTTGVEVTETAQMVWWETGAVGTQGGSEKHPQVLTGTGDHSEEGANDGAAIDLLTVGTGGIPFGIDAFPDVAGGQAVGEFHPLHAAAGTVDGRGGDVPALVHDAPFGSYLFAHFIIVGEGGLAGIALFTVEATTGNQNIHTCQMFMLT